MSGLVSKSQKLFSEKVFPRNHIPDYPFREFATAVIWLSVIFLQHWQFVVSLKCSSGSVLLNHSVSQRSALMSFCIRTICFPCHGEVLLYTKQILRLFLFPFSSILISERSSRQKSFLRSLYPASQTTSKQCSPLIQVCDITLKVIAQLLDLDLS